MFPEFMFADKDYLWQAIRQSVVTRSQNLDSSDRRFLVSPRGGNCGPDPPNPTGPDLECTIKKCTVKVM